MFRAEFKTGIIKDAPLRVLKPAIILWSMALQLRFDCCNAEILAIFLTGIGLSLEGATV